MGQDEPGIPGPKNKNLGILGAKRHPPDLAGVKGISHLDKSLLQPFHKPIKLKPGNIPSPGHTDYHISKYPFLS
jgi:hypothetical protein